MFTELTEVLAQRWKGMKFRSQLTYSHVGVLLLGLVCMSAAVLYLSNDVLMERGFDLLEATNVASLKRLNERFERVSRAVDSCGSDAAAQWKEFTAKSYLLSYKTFPKASAPAGRVVEVVASKIPKVELRFSCWPDSQHVTLATLSPSWLTEVFLDRTGLGESGENYLVATSGRLITGSRFLSNPHLAPIPAVARDHYLILKRDYRNISVLADWRSVSIGTFRGFLASEIDEAEVRGPVLRLAKATFVVAVLIALFVSLLVPRLSIVLSKNVERALELEAVRSVAVFEGQENERHRISLELHDDIGQKLTALAWRVASAPIDGRYAQDFSATVNSISSDLRSLTSGLSTSVLRSLGLVESLNQLFEEMKSLAQTRNIVLHYRITGDQTEYAKLSQELGMALYRVVQESLCNVMKYAQPTQRATLVTPATRMATAANVFKSTESFGGPETWVVARCDIELGREAVSLRVSDSGAGFDGAKIQSGMGLKIMKIRVESLGGVFRLDSKFGQGTVLSARFLLNPPELNV